MSKSNPSALNGVVGVEATLKGHPHPDAMLLDHHHHRQSVEGYPNGSDHRRTSYSTSSSALSNSHRWSDYTLTGSVSGRSTYSWGQDEAELDCAATESVRRKFDRIDAALFEGRSTGCVRVDEECREWSNRFPHLEVRGIHLLDSMEDGTEMVAPDPFLATSLPEEPEVGTSKELMIAGQKMKPYYLQDLDESSPLYEEVIAMDGNLEEFFAFDNTNDEVQVSESHRRSRLKRHHGLPPVTPNACIRDGVMSLAFNNLWTEVVSILQPLIAAIRENYSQGPESVYSLCDSSLTPTEPVVGSRIQHQEQSYVLRGLRDPPTLARAPGQTGSKVKYPNPALQPGVTPTTAVTLPQLTTNLSGVMQIRSVPLQQRAHSSYVPNVFPINDTSRECTPTPSERPESSAVALRFTKLSTPLPRGGMDYPPVPTTPAPAPLNLNMTNRLISSRMTSRRNINTATLKPIEKPKTPSLAVIDSGIRGFKLGGGAIHNSPPSTPFVRNTQLPPLEGPGAGGGVMMMSSVNNGHAVLTADRSPIMQARISAQNQRNRVTFNSRIVSAADGTELWNLSRPTLIPAGPSTSATGTELRPNTTSTSSRHMMASMDPPNKSSVNRKVSDNNFGHMKVVGYAAGFHGGGMAGGVAGGAAGDMREKVASAVIVEDEEVLDGDPSFTVTGKSGIFQSKPRSVSSRTKSRGHIR